MPAERKGLDIINTLDYLRIARKLHSGAEKISSKEFGRGLRFTTPGHNPPATLEIYPRDSVVIFQTVTERLELKNVTIPNFTPEGIIFQKQGTGKERYLMIGYNGEVVFLLGSSLQQLSEDGGIPSPVIPPRTYPPSTVAVSLDT